MKTAQISQKIHSSMINLGSSMVNGLQAGAPEGACHDNVKSLGKNIIQLLDFHLQIFRHIAEKHI